MCKCQHISCYERKKNLKLCLNCCVLMVKWEKKKYECETETSPYAGSAQLPEKTLTQYVWKMS